MKWDGNPMGRTIALKLSEKEDQLVTQLNKQGMTNSELLRNALRQYFESLKDSINDEQQEKNKADTPESLETVVQQSFEQLKGEMQELQDITRKNQGRVENQIIRLEWDLHQLTASAPVSKRFPDSKVRRSVVDIHHEVDEFLKKRSHR
jgi:transposase-like protein